MSDGPILECRDLHRSFVEGPLSVDVLRGGAGPGGHRVARRDGQCR